MANYPPTTAEDGIEVPYAQINPDTLKKMLEEFVSREWSSLTDEGYSLEDKVEQVLEQLEAGRVKVLFDFGSGTANLVAAG